MRLFADTAFVTPFEVAFIAEEGPASFAINRLIDVIFFIDLICNFFMPFRNDARNGGGWVYDNRKIACGYLKGWFVLDLATTVPFGTIVRYANPPKAEEQLEADASAVILRAVRVFRVVKLARILRASRIIKRWQDYIGLSFAMMSLVRFLVLVCVLAHWLACAWGYMGGDDNGDAVANRSWTAYEDGLTWRERHRVLTNQPWELYTVCLYVALNNVFGGSCEIFPASYAEFVVQSCMILLGGSVWAYVIGSACGIIATIDPAMIEHRQTMDELNIFVDDQGMPLDLAVKLRSYFRNTLHLVRAKRYEHLLLEMSTKLRGDASYMMAKRQLASVPYLHENSVEPEFLSHLAVRFSLAVFSRLEHVPCVNLFIIDRGVVAKNGNLGLARACFGKDVILSKESLRDLADAIALTFVQTIQLTRQDIMQVVEDFPMANHTISRYAFRIALTRTLVKAAAACRRGDLEKGTTMQNAGDAVLAMPSRSMAAAMRLPTLPWDQRKCVYPAPSELVATAMFRHKPADDRGIDESEPPNLSVSPYHSRGARRAVPSGAAMVGLANKGEVAAAEAAALPAEIASLKQQMERLIIEVGGQMQRMEGKMDQLSLSTDKRSTPSGRPLQKARHAKSTSALQNRPSKGGTQGKMSLTTNPTDERNELLEVNSATTAALRSNPFEA